MKRLISKTSLLIVILFVFTVLFSGVVFSADSNARVKVIIEFTDLPGPAEQALVRAFGGEVDHTYTIVNAIAATVPEVALAGLSRNPHVTGIEPDVKIYKSGEIDNVWGVLRIGSGEVHNSGNTGQGIKVAVIDSGIDYNHPELDGVYEGGYDFVNNDNDPMDDEGHGTHVAGTIAAEANGTGIVGVAPGARIYALKVLGSDGSGSFSDVIAALEWCVANGIQVTNNSYGSSVDPGSAVQVAFDSSYDAGVLHISSAGNSGNPPGRGDNVGYPGNYSSVMAVAATDSSDSRAKFSSTGPGVEISAPGVSILSTYPGGGYATASGTSMASPHVAGVAALVMASGTTNPATVRSILISTADDLGAVGFDEKYGFGIVDAPEASGTTPGPVNEAPVVNILSPADGSNFESGATVAFSGTATDAEDGVLSGQISWTSSLDGPLGNGASLTAVLGDGTHTITATVSDSDGAASESSVTVTIGNPPVSNDVVSVSDIDYWTSGGKGGAAHLEFRIFVVDDTSTPVAGASLSLDLYLGDSVFSSYSGITDTSGTVSFKIPGAPSGLYTSIVTGVVAEGYAWDGETPFNEFEK